MGEGRFISKGKEAEQRETNAKVNRTEQATPRNEHARKKVTNELKEPDSG